MELYNSIIKGTAELLGSAEPKHYAYSKEKAWRDTEVSELVMQRDAAFELGEQPLPSANFSCVTSDETLVSEDEILVYGPELSELGKAVPFARIAICLVSGIDASGDDTEPAFRAIQDIDFVKYHVFPEGYMVRTSSESNREQVRISKKALSQGISFEKIGCDYIKHYHANPNIKAVKLIFITAQDANYKQLAKNAKDVHDITLTLSKILEGMPTDCSSCNLKPICDEVEGLKELHFGKEAKEFK